jgi:alpha-L-fucosidase
VGRGAGLNLNLPPDRRGQINEHDIAALREFRRILDATFSSNLTKGAKFAASNIRKNSDLFSPAHLAETRPKTYWSTDDSVTTPELVIELGRPLSFNVVSIREYLPLGQRVDAFALDQWQDGKWIEFANGTSIGNHRLVRGEKVTTDRVRLRITKAAACPAIAEFGLYAEPKVAN